MIDKDLLLELKRRKNLLAFSAGVDSTALFFLLLESNIDFDIAIVDYNRRESSKEEIEYAKKLSKKYSKQIYIKSVKIETGNFEKEARDIRYSFFEEIIEKEGYENLITAHQLNDRVEWFFMQFTKGAGVCELLGIKESENRGGYRVIRPLIKTSRERIYSYLAKNNILYFEDRSNENQKYRRNYFRHNFTNRLIEEFEKGIVTSFEFLSKDIDSLNLDIEIFNKKRLYVFKDIVNSIKIVDRIFKKEGILLSKKQKDEIESNKECVISHKLAISYEDGFVYIAPYLKVDMDKKTRDRYRRAKIPPKIRSYIKYEEIDIMAIEEFRA